ncbi:tRNA/tmRNA/rRNA uracil-C5-methylase (TrmA/RlmC/RlmD family) [Microlunatus panaciterrae]|uniref:tRNA/tmRNA/rRNA uracil-C5-methylase (TrmA/RlmC/RlmD family) n=1 Tax=Microlunatus panaciterrae TaxID=400768 RepID=A0ABS2RQ09_9ACTN|nr:class I SAM-dependent RNA methyltransferase [Microlunatus panaciterrae]MBM7800682.1 tRNA/tmRNA/rRNA uracil-C5-methylase (TrmA/RlmC/RlmD family) [Microlunatus panaciterrae]
MSSDPPLEVGPLRIGPVAHGGHCVARHDGRVIFVRHGLPGELVRVLITDQGTGRFWRGDVIEVIEASEDRVTPPCPISGPGGCGGCDFQHVALAAQRRLKAAVVAEQLHHLARIDWTGTVEPVPTTGGQGAEPSGLGWRTRMRYHVDAAGRLGMHRHRSHEVIPLPDQGCAIAAESSGLTDRHWPPGAEVQVVRATSGPVVLVNGRTLGEETQGGPAPVGGQRRPTVSVTERAVDRDWRVRADGFWQVHPAAADLLVRTVLEGLRPRPGEQAFDLYSGVGLFAGALADAGCRVWAVESGRSAVADARHNLADVADRVKLVAGRVDQRLAQLPGRSDLVVLDPPRSGAGRAVMQAIAARRPRSVAYVACDPAALGRDLGTAHDLGYDPESIRAFDLFPMTQHVECVAILTRR